MKNRFRLTLLVACIATTGAMADEAKPEASPDPVPGHGPQTAAPAIPAAHEQAQSATATTVLAHAVGPAALPGDGALMATTRSEGMPVPVDSVHPSDPPPSSAAMPSQPAAGPAAADAPDQPPPLLAAPSRIEHLSPAALAALAGPAGRQRPQPLDALDATSQQYLDSQRDHELAYAEQLREAQREVTIIELEAKAADLKSKIRKANTEGTQPQAPVVPVEPMKREVAAAPVPPPAPPVPPPKLKSIIGMTALVTYDGSDVQVKAGDKLGDYKVDGVVAGSLLLSKGKDHTVLHTVW